MSLLFDINTFTSFVFGFFIISYSVSNKFINGVTPQKFTKPNEFKRSILFIFFMFFSFKFYSRIFLIINFNFFIYYLIYNLLIYN